MGSWQPPPGGKNAQSRLLLCRRWSTPGLGPPSSTLYTHYVHGDNDNEAEMRHHRKQLYQKNDGKASAKLRAAYVGAIHAGTTAAMILAWSREKYKGWARRQPREVAERGESRSDRYEVTTPASTLTRKSTLSRMSGKSRDSVVRLRSQSSLMSSSDTEEEKPKNIRTFWWYCGVIKALCKLGLDMQWLSMRKTEQTALSELYYVSVGGTSAGQDEDNQILFFDKTLFTRKRAACRVPEWAQNLMILRPEDRKPEDVQRLKNLLMSMRSFREKYTDDMRTKICQVVRYTRCDKGRVVLRQGHLGLYFYFIFSGSVFIQIDLYDPKTGHTAASTENIIRTGDSFGSEIALLGDGTRSATVICREPTELCQIDKSTFLDICPDIFQQQLDEKIAFAKKFELFKKWEEESLKQLCFVSQMLYIPHGRVLELDWAQAQYVYFVMTGRLSMIKEFEMNEDGTATTGGGGEKEDGKRQGKEEEEDWGWDWEEELQLQEEDERYNILLATVPGAQQLVQKATPTDTRFACVGTLRDGQTTDLRILSLNPLKIPSITLLSEGVRVLRIAVRNFARFAPRKDVEEYLRKRYRPMVIPDSKAIVRRYRRDMSWRTFRKCVMGTLARTQAGQLLSTLSSTSKGTSGWARWPGFDPWAEEKSALLSQRGWRSETVDFPVVKLPPAYERQRRLSARRGRKPEPPKSSVYIRSLTTASSSASGSSRRADSATVVNDRQLVMYPPRKLNAAFLRRKQAES